MADSWDEGITYSDYLFYKEKITTRDKFDLMYKCKNDSDRKELLKKRYGENPEKPAEPEAKNISPKRLIKMVWVYIVLALFVVGYFITKKGKK